MNLMSGGMWGIGYVVVEMRTRNLLKRLVATPMSRAQFLLSFVLMRALFILFALPVLLGFAWAAFHVGIPIFVASGVFFSTSRFPAAVQPFLRVLPLTALNDALRAVMIDGAGLTAVAPQLALLAGLALVTFALALRLFRWR